MTESSLFRLSRTSLSSNPELTQTQATIDSGVTHFLEEAARPSTFASIVAGGGASRLARGGILALGANATGRSALAVQAFASVGSLSAEVVAFEGASRGLSSLSGEGVHNPNLFRWQGEGGFGQGVTSSFINFGALRWAGHLSQGQNFVFQHAAQSAAMVGGHNFAGALGIIHAPEGPLAMQFFEAERTNISLGAGMGFLHATLPGLHAFERSLDTANRARQQLMNRPREGSLSAFGPRLAAETASGAPAIPVEARREIEATPQGMRMEAMGDPPSSGGNGGEQKIPSVPSPVRVSEINGNGLGNGSGNGNGGPPSIGPGSPSIPPPPPPGRPRSSRRGIFQLLMAPFIWTGEHFNLNVAFNPDGRLPSSHVDGPAAKIGSVEEGMARMRARGLDRRTMGSVRRDLHDLRESPELQLQYLQLMDKVFDAQNRLREAFDPILDRRPHLDKREANEAERVYSEALQRLTPNAGRYFAEATLLFWRTRNLRTAQDFANISDAQLRDMGIEPDAIASLRRHGHSFPRNQMETILNHPLLRDLPETASLRQAMRQFYGDTVSESLLSRLEDPSVRDLPESGTARDILRRFDAQNPWESLQKILGDPPRDRPETNEQRILRLTIEIQLLRRKTIPAAEELAAPLLEKIETLEGLKSFRNEEGRREIDRLRESVRSLREASEVKKLEDLETRGNQNFQEAAQVLRQILERSLSNSENGKRVFETLQDYGWSHLTFGRQRVMLEEVARIRGPVAEMRRQIAKTRDAVERKRLEGEIKRLSESLKRPYMVTTGRFNEEVTAFLSDPVRARIFLVENTRQTALIRGLQDADRSALAGRVREARDGLSTETRRTADEFLNASQEMDLVNSRGLLKRLFMGALRVFDLDPHPPLEVRGRYERTLVALIQEAPQDTWNFGPSRLALLREAATAETRSRRAYYDLARRGREGWEPLEREINALWDRFDRDLNEIYSSDLGLQIKHALSEVRNPQATVEAREAAEAAIAKFDNPDAAIRGRNGRDVNRTQEGALQKTSELRKAVRKESGSDFRVVSATMAPVSEKMDRKWYSGFGETALSLGTILWHTPMMIAKLVSSIKRGETAAVGDRRFQEWSLFQSRGGNWMIGWIQRTFGFQDNFIVDPNTTYLVERGPISNPGKHDSWYDFARGGTPLARSVQLNGRHSHRDAVRILAKQGLDLLVGPILGPGIKMLTEEVGDSAPEFDGSVTNAARAMAYGDRTSGRLGPRSTMAFDEISMSVASLLHPYAYDPYPPTSSMLEIGQGGRSFNIADRATALTGRAQDMLLTVTLNAYTAYPKPDVPLPMRRGPLTTVTEWWPYFALTSAEGSQKSRANLLRTLWYIAATTPEYERPVPAIERMYRPYERPGDPATEAMLESRYGGDRALYPSIEGVQAARSYVTTLEGRLRSLDLNNPSEAARRPEIEGELRTARQALVNYEIQFYETPTGRERLRQENATLEPSIQNAEIHVELAHRLGANRWELRELRRAAEGRREIHNNVLDALHRNTPLSETHLREWISLRNTMQAAATRPDAQRILDQLGGLISQVSGSEIPERRRILSLLKSRRAQVAIGNARLSLGERLGPTEEVLMAEMEGSLLFHDPNRPHDPLVSVLTSGIVRRRVRGTVEITSTATIRDLLPNEIRELLAEETIRETTRRLIRRLPGAGRGEIDSVRESAEAVSQVIRNGLGQVIRGPTSGLRALDGFGFRFIAGCVAIFTSAIPDLFTGNRFQLYNKAASALSRWAMAPTQYRPVLNPEDVRVLENVRLQANREKRPVAIVANHLSWADITAIMEVVPETRFGFKGALYFVPFLNLALLAGRHTRLIRPPTDASLEVKARAFARVRAAGQKMIDYGVSTLFFLPGTRSKTGSIGRPKTGAANLALGTNAIVLGASLLGTNELLPIDWGRFAKQGTGLHRRIYSRFSVIDPDTFRTDHKDVSLDDVSSVTQRSQDALATSFLRSVEDLRTLANQGDLMAEAQLAQLMRDLEPGMNLIRMGRTQEAQWWAEGNKERNKKDQGQKTSYEFLERLTHWWDGSTPP